MQLHPHNAETTRCLLLKYLKVTFLPGPIERVRATMFFAAKKKSWWKMNLDIYFLFCLADKSLQTRAQGEEDTHPFPSLTPTDTSSKPGFPVPLHIWWRFWTGKGSWYGWGWRQQPQYWGCHYFFSKVTKSRPWTSQWPRPTAPCHGQPHTAGNASSFLVAVNTSLLLYFFLAITGVTSCQGYLSCQSFVPTSSDFVFGWKHFHLVLL